ncbi:hypothetical protein [Kribbella sp. C-35]|uniref:hypothetical protein n=1 Tax=Kribbella sp. C-35 TaxID=2789276 RepID=UPI0039784784
MRGVVRAEVLEELGDLVRAGLGAQLALPGFRSVIGLAFCEIQRVIELPIA